MQQHMESGGIVVVVLFMKQNTLKVKGVWLKIRGQTTSPLRNLGLS